MEIDDELSNKYICHQCIGDEYLSNDVRTSGKKHKCGYCGSREPAIALEELADRTEAAFAEHMERTPTEVHIPYMIELTAKQPDYDAWQREGAPVVEALRRYARLTEKPAKDTQKLLAKRYADQEQASVGDEYEFSETSFYERKEITNPNSCQHLWQEFETSIKQKSRFINKAASELLDHVFENISDAKAMSGEPVIVDAGPNEKISCVYRAREFTSKRELYSALTRPNRELGPPPHKLAKAGRVNAEGISVFYCATLEDTALAEVRPAVGSHVAVGRFDLIRKVRLLDLTALRKMQAEFSIYDVEARLRKERARFLADLCLAMSKPVLPHETRLNYLPTQAVADYLAGELNPCIDGIIYPSTQANGEGLNIVLFNKVSKVVEEQHELVHRSEHNSKSLEVHELVKSKSILKLHPETLRVEEGFVPEANPDAYLAIDVSSISTHHVERIVVQTATERLRLDLEKEHSPIVSYGVNPAWEKKHGIRFQSKAPTSEETTKKILQVISTIRNSGKVD